jgi:hypothetical protein
MFRRAHIVTTVSGRVKQLVAGITAQARESVTGILGIQLPIDTGNDSRASGRTRARDRMICNGTG